VVAVHPAYDDLFDAFARKCATKARQEWSYGTIEICC
jgi:hypothetical protein